MIRAIISIFVGLISMIMISCQNQTDKAEKTQAKTSDETIYKLDDETIYKLTGEPLPADSIWFSDGLLHERFSFTDYDSTAHPKTVFITNKLDSLTKQQMVVRFKKTTLVALTGFDTNPNKYQHYDSVYSRDWMIYEIEDKESKILLTPHSDQDLSIFRPNRTIPDTIDIIIGRDESALGITTFPIQTSTLKVVTNVTSRYRDFMTLSEIEDINNWIKTNQATIEKLLQLSTDKRLSDYGITSPWKKDPPKKTT